MIFKNVIDTRSMLLTNVRENILVTYTIIVKAQLKKYFVKIIYMGMLLAIVLSCWENVLFCAGRVMCDGYRDLD